MSVLAIIPARGGSKGIPGKNLATVGDIPLITRAVATALASGRIDRVIVSTDDSAIADAAATAGAEVVWRPAELAGDTASSESALLHVLNTASRRVTADDIVVFLQATSPFIAADDVDAAIARVANNEADVVFSAVATYAFLWANSPDGAVGVNHDASFRPRRQDRDPHYRETGAFYVMRAAGFVEARFRFFGRVAIAEVADIHSLEIDSPHELEAARALSALAEATPAAAISVTTPAATPVFTPARPS